jgi:hypothetical protein
MLHFWGPTPARLSARPSGCPIWFSRIDFGISEHVRLRGKFLTSRPVNRFGEWQKVLNHLNEVGGVCIRRWLLAARWSPGLVHCPFRIGSNRYWSIVLVSGRNLRIIFNEDCG